MARTLNLDTLQHPSSTVANLTLNDDGSVSGGLPTAGRNLLYNSAMQVAQRGTSTASITSGPTYPTADRWQVNMSSLGTYTQSVENDAPTGSGFRKSLKMLCTTADASPAGGDYCGVEQLLEGQDLQRIKKGTASAEKVTLSFWAKSNVTGTYIVELVDNDNNRSVSAAYTVSASATWEKKVITFPADTTGAFDNDNAASLRLVFSLGSGSTRTSGTLQTTWGTMVEANRYVGQTNLSAATNNYWQVTGVQLEVGPVATPFEFEPYETTLRKCQRYYQVFINGSVQMIGVGFQWSASAGNSAIHFNEMRTTPTLSALAGTNYYYMGNAITGSYGTTLTVGVFSPNACEVDLNNSWTQGNVGIMRSSSASAFAALQAEL